NSRPHKARGAREAGGDSLRLSTLLAALVVDSTGRRKVAVNSDNTKKRVVVTGIGLVSPLGNTTEETWAGLVAGRSGVDYITRFDTSQHKVKFAAETKNFDPAKFIEKKELKKMDYFIYFAVAAAREALERSGLKIT